MREVLSDAGLTDRRPPFRFSGRFRPDVGDTDLNGHVNYGTYQRYLDRVALAYRRHLDIPAMGPPGHHLVVRAVSVEYHASAELDDEVEVFVRVSAIGRTSHSMDMLIERLGDDPIRLAEGRLTAVGLDGPGGRPSLLPDHMRAAIVSFEGDTLELPGST